jgi:hypothetical protein
MLAAPASFVKKNTTRGLKYTRTARISPRCWRQALVSCALITAKTSPRSGPNWVYIWKVIARKLCIPTRVRLNLWLRQTLYLALLFVSVAVQCWVTVEFVVSTQTHTRACEWNGKEKWKEKEQEQDKSSLKDCTHWTQFICSTFYTYTRHKKSFTITLSAIMSWVRSTFVVVIRKNKYNSIELLYSC